MHPKYRAHNIDRRDANNKKPSGKIGAKVEPIAVYISEASRNGNVPKMFISVFMSVELAHHETLGASSEAFGLIWVKTG
jgi:hypothetical protein